MKSEFDPLAFPVAGHPYSMQHSGGVREYARLFVCILVKPFDLHFGSAELYGTSETAPSVVTLDHCSRSVVLDKHPSHERFANLHRFTRIDNIGDIYLVISPHYVTYRT